VMKEITLKTNACFMNGMSFLMRKNSMILSLLNFSSYARSACDAGTRTPWSSSFIPA
jgi:hypothetical protein